MTSASRRVGLLTYILATIGCLVIGVVGAASGYLVAEIAEVVNGGALPNRLYLAISFSTVVVVTVSLLATAMVRLEVGG